MSEDQRGDGNPNQEADATSHHEPPVDQSTYWEEFHVVLNYLFQESWYGYILCGLSVTGLVYWI